MAALTPDALKVRLKSAALPDLVRETLFDGEVHALKAMPGAIDALRTHLATKLNLRDKASVVVVGSAKTGYSLSPDAFPRAFSAESDIDVAIIDADLFDRCWFALVQWHYQRPNRMAKAEHEWSRQRSDDIYWGWLVPHKIRFPGALGTPDALRPLREVQALWFDAFRSVGRLPPFSSRDVTGRLYRTEAHAVEYHVSGFRQLRRRFARTT